MNPVAPACHEVDGQYLVLTGRTRPEVWGDRSPDACPLAGEVLHLDPGSDGLHVVPPAPRPRPAAGHVAVEKVHHDPHGREPEHPRPEPPRPSRVSAGSAWRTSRPVPCVSAPASRSLDAPPVCPPLPGRASVRRPCRCSSRARISAPIVAADAERRIARIAYIPVRRTGSCQPCGTPVPRGSCLTLYRTSPKRSSAKFAKRRASSASQARPAEPVVIGPARLLSSPRRSSQRALARRRFRSSP
jgi:hypothetical protein